MRKSEKQQRTVQEHNAKVIAHEYPKQVREEPVLESEGRKPIIKLKKKRTFVKPE